MRARSFGPQSIMAAIYELVKKGHSDVLDERAVESKAVRFLANKLSYTP